MYRGTARPRSARSRLDTPPDATPEAAAQQALARVRKLLTGYVPGMPFDAARLLADLAVSLPDAVPERERLFARGWLSWLEGSPEAAEALLDEAVGIAEQEQATEALAETAYWRDRVRLSLGREDALTHFEAVLRKLAGSPQGTAWFIDLLWRGGRLDRAEQVWKSVRGNRRVTACPEAPLLEARLLLRRGELAPAERLLQDPPANGVLWVERLLLLAWLRTVQRQGEQVRSLLQQARQGPYPAAALQLWSERIEQRLRGETADLQPGAAAPALRDYLAGQQARRDGRTDAALAAYQAALQMPAAQPFARYALAALGQDDWAALLASAPGLFLAARCRTWLTLERFRQRQATPAEWLEALRQATAQGYQSPRAEHFRRLALLLQERQATPEQLQSLAAESRNGMRIAVELAVRTLPPEAARELILGWSRRDFAAGDEALCTLLGRHLLYSLLLTPHAAPQMYEAAQHLLPGEPLTALALPDGGPGTTPAAFLADAVPDSVNAAAVQLAQAGRLLAAGLSAEDIEPWRQRVRLLRGVGRVRGLAQALLVQEAAGRGDVTGVAALLEETDAWRGAAALPPEFVIRAVEHVAAGQPASAGWQRSLARWLEAWDQGRLKARAEGLLVQTGLLPLSGETAQPPAGMPAAPWLLHQAARAIGREDARTALALVRRVVAMEGEAIPEAAKAALPDLERWSRAQALGSLIQDSCAAGASAAQLVDLADLLESLPEGQAVLAAVERGERDEALARLEALALREDMPARMAHHLALLAQRAALTCGQADNDEALPCWRLAWRCWLRFLAAGLSPDARRVLLDWLLTHQRQRLEDLLARNAVGSARHVWDLVQRLAELTGDEALRQDLEQRIGCFRDELATDYLVGTREAMRYGAIPEGWRADYDTGLTYLRRLLSLDRDNPRLLAALVEVCTEWFLDLYHATAAPLLQQQVERFTPFAQHLARLIDGRPAELAARAALADFWKFRGFVAADRHQKIALYREALAFNPANTNVQSLLAELEPHGQTETDA
jgi:hypothetical protein